jgi:hypothetical protein
MIREGHNSALEDVVPDGASPIDEAIEACSAQIQGGLMMLEARYGTAVVSGEILQAAILEFLGDIRDQHGKEAANRYAAIFGRAIAEFIDGQR